MCVAVNVAVQLFGHTTKCWWMKCFSVELSSWLWSNNLWISWRWCVYRMLCILYKCGCYAMVLWIFLGCKLPLCSNDENGRCVYVVRECFQTDGLGVCSYILRLRFCVAMSVVAFMVFLWEDLLFGFLAGPWPYHRTSRLAVLSTW